MAVDNCLDAMWHGMAWHGRNSKLDLPVLRKKECHTGVNFWKSTCWVHHAHIISFCGWFSPWTGAYGEGCSSLSPSAGSQMPAETFAAAAFWAATFAVASTTSYPAACEWCGRQVVFDAMFIVTSTALCISIKNIFVIQSLGSRDFI